jgi:hypothetical protein
MRWSVKKIWRRGPTRVWAIIGSILLLDVDSQNEHWPREGVRECRLTARGESLDSSTKKIFIIHSHRS